MDGHRSSSLKGFILTLVVSQSGRSRFWIVLVSIIFVQDGRRLSVVVIHDARTKYQRRTVSAHFSALRSALQRSHTNRLHGRCVRWPD